VTAASFSRKLKDLLINSITLSLCQEGLTSLVRDTPAETSSNIRPKKQEKPQNLKDAEQIRDEAVTPLGQTLAGKAVMKLERQYRANCRKQTADWESLFGQRIDKRGSAHCKPRHEEHVFSNTKDKEASGCIQNYFENLFNKRGWTKDVLFLLELGPSA
jgi:ABC-type transporter MlaC component